MSSELQLHVCQLNQWWRQLVNAYEAKTQAWRKVMAAYRAGMTYVTCGLTACTLGSAQYERTSLLPYIRETYSVAAPKIWNSLPPALRMCTSHDTFRHQLKTHYFQLAFQPT